MKWFWVISGAISSSLTFLEVFPDWLRILYGVYGALSLAFGMRRFSVEKEIKIKQKNITADSNKGVSFNNVPAIGAELPPINIEQKNIQARENVGLEFNHNPNSGPVKMNHTSVEGDGTKVVINPAMGSVIINPAVGSVKFNYQK